MLITLVIPIVTSIVIAALLYFFGGSNSYGIKIELTRKELVLGLVATLALSPLISWIGGKMAVDDAVGGYKEFWNGSMTLALSERVPCERDGNCRHSYDCDGYKVVDQAAYTDSDGNYHSEISHTEYHDCPYATEEYNYWLLDSLGDTHELWMGWFSTSPQEWRGGHGIPSDVGRGVPPEWTRIKELIAEGRAPGVTKENTYTNYVLASTNSILKPFSADVERYKEEGLLPAHTENWKSPMLNDYTANKVVFVGDAPGNASEWQDALARFNGALGMELQGDMHIVVVPAAKVDNPDAYKNAVRAYWQGKEFGKRALGKNGIIVVVALNRNGDRVEWVRADTGMPTGNGEMETALSAISDVPATPYTLIGDVMSKPSGEEVEYIHGDGVIESIVFNDHPFKRACMECKDKGDTGESYTYLKKDVKLTGWAKFWIAFMSIFANALVWAVLWYTDLFGESQQAESNIHRDRWSY
ncbi:hypothetical protein KC973_00745 [Candidatus Saccharibacteria bacterium]|nr:hypothetical protein [Candidatus Saccharibacteria bacterium]